MPEKKIEKAVWIIFTSLIAISLGYLGGVKAEGASKKYVDTKDNALIKDIEKNTEGISKLREKQEQSYILFMSELKDMKKEINKHTDTRFEDIKDLIKAIDK